MTQEGTNVTQGASQSKKAPIADEFSKTIQGWNESLKRLEVNARTAELSAREKMHSTLQSLKQKKEELEGKIDDLNLSSKDAAKDVKEGLKRSTQELTEAFREAEQRFS